MVMEGERMKAKDIKWDEEVEEYKVQYDGEDGIFEYVENLVPIYYRDIQNTFNSMSVEIAADDVGLTISQVMQKHIFDDYLESFMEAWSLSKYEEE